MLFGNGKKKKQKRRLAMLKEIRRKKKKMAKALKKAQRKSLQKFQIVKPVSFGEHKKINKNANINIVLPVKIPSLISKMGKKNFYKLSQYCFRLQRKYLRNLIASKKQKKYDMLSTNGFYCFGVLGKHLYRTFVLSKIRNLDVRKVRKRMRLRRKKNFKKYLIRKELSFFIKHKMLSKIKPYIKYLLSSQRQRNKYLFLWSRLFLLMSKFNISSRFKTIVNARKLNTKNKSLLRGKKQQLQRRKKLYKKEKRIVQKKKKKDFVKFKF